MILKYLPLIYLNHNRYKIETYMHQYFSNSNFKFIPHKFNYFLHNYYNDLKKMIQK
jgi:hypothetical protein